jgi:hypothetical protein
MAGEPIPCRLCHGRTHFRYRITLLKTYEVGLYECEQCASMQTEEPHWLDRSYAEDNLVMDVGKAQRCLLTSVLCAYLLERIGIGKAPCLDWGAGEGLFCRFMRDRGLNFFSYDKYVTPIYSAPFQVDDPGSLSPAAITAFEVFEHLPYPARELGAIFELKPLILIFTTELYEGQGEDWNYLSRHSGKHVFFYSRRAMDLLAERHGYRFVQFPYTMAFVSRRLWEDVSLESQKMSWERIVARSDTSMADALECLRQHFANDPWKYVMADYFEVRRRTLGY